MIILTLYYNYSGGSYVNSAGQTVQCVTRSATASLGYFVTKVESICLITTITLCDNNNNNNNNNNNTQRSFLSSPFS